MGIVRVGRGTRTIPLLGKTFEIYCENPLHRKKTFEIDRENLPHRKKSLKLTVKIRDF
jgi:hypothetical protein